MKDCSTSGKITTFMGYRCLMPSCAGFLEPRKSRLRLSKSTFSTQLLHVYLNWFWHSSLLKSVLQPEITKKSIKLLFWRSGAFKVIEFGASREPVYDFLLVINSNLGPVSHHFWDTVTYWLKIANFSTPFHLAPLFRMTRFEFMEKLYGSWN